MRIWHKKLTFRDRQILAAAAAALGLASNGDRSALMPGSLNQAIKTLARHLASGSVSLQALAAHLGRVPTLRLAPPAALLREERRLRKTNDHETWRHAVQLACRERVARRRARDARAQAEQAAKRAKLAAWEQARLRKNVEPAIPIPVHPRLDPRYPRIWALRKNGKTFRQIGDDLGISGQRVSQILEKTRRILKWPKEALQRKAVCTHCKRVFFLGKASKSRMCIECRVARTCTACGQRTVRAAGRRLCDSCRIATRPCGACGTPVTRDRGARGGCFRNPTWYCNRSCFGRYIGQMFGARGNLTEYAAGGRQGTRTCNACGRQFASVGGRRICPQCRSVTKPCNACETAITRERDGRDSTFYSKAWYCNRTCFQQRAKRAADDCRP
jgi:DNA-binding CsgD family transcriptional regulator